MMERFMPHGMCFLWEPGVLSLHVISDALIALAYFSIPLVLVWLVRHRNDLPFAWLLWMFSIFIVSCGLTHVMAIVVIWYPLYWLEGAIKGITAAASLATAVALVPILPRALSLRSPAELERVNEQLQRSIDESATLLRRYEREHYIATTLQSASLGDVPGRLGPLHLSAMYRPGVGDLEIGGDWYDAFRLPDGRTIVSIGDVAGKGLGASVIMAKMRQAIRVAAQVQVAPDAILDAADRSLALEHPDAVVTAFVGIIDDTDAVLVYANAGHPAPLLRHPDGGIVELRASGLPLGLRSRDASAATLSSVELVPGSLLVLYTDGVTESTHDFAEGERRLFAALRDDVVADSADPARGIHDRVLFDGVRDDVAILAVRFGGDADDVERWEFPVSDGDAARATREAIVARLVERGASTDEAFAAELVYGELIGNVARHAPGKVDVRLDWLGTAPVLHVLDRGAGFAFAAGLPSDMFAESGRGLFIVANVTRDFAITPRPHGGSHARALLPLAFPRRGLLRYVRAER